MSGSHEAMGWLLPDSDFDLDAAAARLAERLPKAKVTRQPRGLSVSIRGREVWLHLVGARHVAAEAKEFAGWYPDDPTATEVGKCKRRVEVECPEEDPRGRHRRDFLVVCSVLEEFHGVILRDPVNGHWL